MRITRLLPALAFLAGLASPAFAMDDQETFWRVDALVEKRISWIAPVASSTATISVQGASRSSNQRWSDPSIWTSSP